MRLMAGVGPFGPAGLDEVAVPVPMAAVAGQAPPPPVRGRRPSIEGDGPGRCCR